MRNYPNIYTSYGPGMPVINGIPGSFVEAMKKILVNGTDPFSIASIVVENGVGTITVVTENQMFFNGARFLIEGCDEPLLNEQFEVEDHNLFNMTFLTTVADGTYTGASMTIRQPGAGWSLLYTGTNTAVFTSGNLDTFGVCIKISDVNALYADLEFFENMTSITEGINKFNPAVYASNRVFRIYKSYNATATKQEYWIAADNTTVHFSIERISTASYAPIPFAGFRGGMINSFGECDAFNTADKKNFFFSIAGYAVDTATTNHTSVYTFNTGISLSPNGYDFLYNPTFWNGGVLTENQAIGIPWYTSCVTPMRMEIGNFIRPAGGPTRTAARIKMPPLYCNGEHFVNITDGSVSGMVLFGRIKEILYPNLHIVNLYRNATKITHNGKKFILLPIYHATSVAATTYDNSLYGMVAINIGQKWGE